MDENRDDVIVLFDEDNNEVHFEHLDTFEIESNIYVVLIELLDDGTENDEVDIFRVETSEEGDEVLAVIDDEEELQAAFDEFSARLEDQFDIDDEE